jgi:hypothetical protein
MANMPSSVLKTLPVLTIGDVTISIVEGSSTFFFKAGMAIDADGAPTAYHRIHGKGLDNLANAGHPGNWFWCGHRYGSEARKPRHPRSE